MEVILRRATKSTPFVHLDRQSSTYVIAGRSIPIDAEMFYQPILNWLDGLLKDPPRLMEFHFHFDFFNIASSKRILFILYKLAELQRAGVRVKVIWLYEKQDDDTLEIGKDYEFMVDELCFEFVEFSTSDSEMSRVLKYG